jgi:hypothetical protein
MSTVKRLKTDRSFKRHLSKVVLINYLKQICTSTGQCIAFGIEQQKVKSVFDNFTHFKHLTNVETIGTPSANGFVLNLHYQNKDFHTNAILKSARSKYSDNVYYEYLVGLFLNKLNKCVPCFVETYNLFSYENNDIKEKIRDKSLIDADLFTSLQLSNCNSNYATILGGGGSATRRNHKKRKLSEPSMKTKKNNEVVQSMHTEIDNAVVQSMHTASTEIDSVLFHTPPMSPNNSLNTRCINESCQNIEKYAILIQYIENPITVGNFIQGHFNERELINILYQVYVVLDYYKYHFTHYDLHLNNVLLYPLPKGHYVTINYENEYTGITTSIQTHYLVKIIDYGRSYFKDTNIDSAEIFNHMNSIGCEYNHFTETFIEPYKRNWSHDLRFAKGLCKRMRRIKRHNILEDCDVYYSTPFGTKESTAPLPGVICTVSDMVEYLEEKLKEIHLHTISSKNREYGVMTVSLTKKMGRIPLQFKRNKY